MVSADCIIKDIKDSLPGLQTKFVYQASDDKLDEIKLIQGILNEAQQPYEYFKLRDTVEESTETFLYSSQFLLNIPFLSEFDSSKHYKDAAFDGDVERTDISLSIDGMPVLEELRGLFSEPDSDFLEQKASDADIKINSGDAICKENRLNYQRRLLMKKFFEVLEQTKLDPSLICFIYFYLPQRSAGLFYTRYDALNAMVNLLQNEFVLTKGSIVSDFCISPTTKDSLQIITTHRYASVAYRNRDDLSIDTTTQAVPALLELKHYFSVEYRCNKLHVSDFRVSLIDHTMQNVFIQYVKKQHLTKSNLALAVINNHVREVSRELTLATINKSLEIPYSDASTIKDTQITALQLAVLVGNADLAANLRDLGADLKYKDAMGKTAADYAQNKTGFEWLSDFQHSTLLKKKLIAVDEWYLLKLDSPYQLSLLAGAKTTSVAGLKFYNKFVPRADDVDYFFRGNDSFYKPPQTGVGISQAVAYQRSVIWHVYDTDVFRQHRQSNFERLCCTLEKGGLQVANSVRYYRIYQRNDRWHLVAIFAFMSFKVTRCIAGCVPTTVEAEKIYSSEDKKALAYFAVDYKFLDDNNKVEIAIFFHDHTKQKLLATLLQEQKAHLTLQQLGRRGEPVANGLFQRPRGEAARAQSTSSDSSSRQRRQQPRG